MFARFWILCLLVLLITLAKAQDKSVIYPTTSAASATVLPDGYGYVYIGCCNETTGIPAVRGARALSGGSGVRLLSERDVSRGLHLTGDSHPTIQ